MPYPPPMARRARWALGATCAVLAVAAAVSTPAHAGKIAAARAQATAAEQRLNDLYARSDAAVEAYNKAVAQLHAVRQAIARNKIALDQAKRDLAAARAHLAEFVVSSYKGTGPSLTYYVLSASSFGDLVNRMDFVNQMSDTESSILDQVRSAERRVAARRAVLKRQRAEAARLVAKRAAERRQVQSLVSQQQGLVASLNSRVKTLIHQRDERRAAAAAAAAAAARRAAQQPTAAAPAPPPRSGGSPPPPAGSLGERAVQIAEGELGVPYVWGGASPSGFDCSGLTMWVYAQLGISLPHFTGGQWVAGPHVPYDQLAPGDLVFFEPSIGHVGIYIGGGSFIHAPHTGDVVKISSLSDSWYAANYQGAVRVTG
jgi:cell wall-associated NlpC family hydrolase